MYNSFYTQEPCIGAPGESCTFANVYFVVTKDDQNVIDLESDAMAMTINDRAVGVEGTNGLTSSNALLVDLLLDRSYSIRSRARPARCSKAR